MNLIQEKQEVVIGDEVALRSLWTLFLFDLLMQREHPQKSIALMTSHDGDSNLLHLFDFPQFFADGGRLDEKQQGVN